LKYRADKMLPLNDLIQQKKVLSMKVIIFINEPSKENSLDILLPQYAESFD